MRRPIAGATLSVVYRAERHGSDVEIQESERKDRWLKATVLAGAMEPRGDS